MKQASVARQPIFDRRLSVVGYELLFRDPPATHADVVDHSGATTTVILNALTEIGLTRVVGTHTAWINASREFLLSGLVATLPARRVGLEILEGQVVDDALVAAVRELAAQGYRFALDDFEYNEDVRPLLELAEIVKLDLVALGRTGMAEHMELLAPYGVTIVAEKVETPEDHEYCLELGCDRFQGFFYRKPELFTDRRIEASRLSLLQLLSALQDPTLQLESVERLIVRDLGLSLRFLRYINSAFFGLRHEVGSIGQALALLGAVNLKRWATLSVFAGIDQKPSELTVTALVRARFCEMTAAPEAKAEAGRLFTLGLFSAIDALLDAPIQEILEAVPFPEDMRHALIAHEGPMGSLLASLVALEAADFDRAETLAPGAAERYLAALTWADDACRQLFEEPEPAGALGGP